MILKPLTYKLIVVFLFVAFALPAQNPNKKQEQLEERKRELEREIEQINTLLFEGKKEQKSVLTTVENLNYKVSVRQNLISITNQQANLLTREINNNQKQITKLRDKLKVLKDEYAAMIVKSYKSKSEQSKVMFLLSSTDFQQAYKRLQYIKQYAKYQKEQGEKIKLETQRLQDLNIKLTQQRKDKQKLIDENRLAKTELDKELKEQEVLIASIKKDLNKHLSQVKRKQQEIDKIDREIARLIREAMASSNKKAGKSTKSKNFALTPEQKLLASNFTSNKGKLPWPVKNGVVKVRYGERPSPIDRTVKIKSSGVRIVTNKNEKVRAVFEGTVFRIMKPKNGNMVIMIQHGNYFTVYKNLSKVNVEIGDKVTTKQVIGEVLTNKATNEAMLAFSVWKKDKPQNPAHWIYKL